MKKTITKHFEFAASHRLNDDNLSEEENKEIFGKCNNLPSHGHTYILEITISGEERNGMILNFNIIKEIYNIYIYEIFDHHFINDLECMKGRISTCENILDVIWEILEPVFLQEDILLEKLKLYETTNSWGELER